MARLVLRPLVSGVLLVVLFVAQVAAQQQQQQPQQQAGGGGGGCNGILVTYTLQGRERIRPFVEPQAYSFRATATVVNGGTRALRSWALLVSFAHGEILVGIDGAVLTSGADLPYNTSSSSSSTTSLSGYPQTDLLTPIATAGDLGRIQATVSLVGTLFAATDEGDEPPLPWAVSLADPSYACPRSSGGGNGSTTLSTCCVPTISNRSTSPAPAPSRERAGDLVITYDVLQAQETTYVALVTLDNAAPLGRLDGWQLSWEWQRGEFISAIRGAYPREVGSAACLYGPQAQHYRGLDFSKVLSCDRRPVLMDLPPSRAQDDAGGIQHCCRNGTLLPRPMLGGAQSVSAFQMEVYKMPPDLNRTALHPPASFHLRGSSPLNPDYACAQPVPVTPSQFPDPTGLPSVTIAVASWQAVCNITNHSAAGGHINNTTTKPPNTKCCVSFSAFYDDSVVPCRTCACGCTNQHQTTNNLCSTTAPALLLPPYALLMPSDRRAKEALTWAADHKDLAGPVPNPLPCPDNCGVSLNWHVAADFDAGWTARLTLFNWQQGDMPHWFAAVVMPAYAGFDQAYSFNATPIGNATIFVSGREGFNDLLLRDTNITGVDYPVPGKVQSVLSFTKKTSPGIDVLAGDGFPSRVFFNGEECAMPLRIPSRGSTNTAGAILNTLLSCLSVASALLLLL
ncbi:unnamed protein product [Urochloa humidicola]